MAEQPLNQQEILNRVYKGPTKTGDNVDGLAHLGYSWDANSTWGRTPQALVNQPYDYQGFSNPDAHGNYQTIVYKQGGSSGTTVVTLTLTYDSSNNITSLTRT